MLTMLLPLTPAEQIRDARAQLAALPVDDPQRAVLEARIARLMPLADRWLACTAGSNTAGQRWRRFDRRSRGA